MAPDPNMGIGTQVKTTGGNPATTQTGGSDTWNAKAYHMDSGDDNDKCRLLSLPPELRNRIYELALLEDSYVRVRVSSRYATEPASALTQTFRQLRHETLRMFYSINLFRFNLWYPDENPSRCYIDHKSDLEAILPRTLTPNLALIQHFQMSFNSRDDHYIIRIDKDQSGWILHDYRCDSQLCGICSTSREASSRLRGSIEKVLGSDGQAVLSTELLKELLRVVTKYS